MTSFEQTDILLDAIEIKLKANKLTNPTTNSTNFMSLREDNLEEISKLYEKLKLSKKHPDFSTLFNYTAMNLAGIGLKDEEFGKIREGKYVQIIAISYELNKEKKRVNKNTSLGYYGKAEKLSEEEKKDIIKFVLRWRYEKSFQHSEQYQQLLEKLY